MYTISNLPIFGSASVLASSGVEISLRWRHNGRHSVSNHQPHDCLLNRLFRRRSKKTTKPQVTGLCAGNSPGTGEFPAQMASNAENVSIWWRHHVSRYSTDHKVGLIFYSHFGYQWLEYIFVISRFCSTKPERPLKISRRFKSWHIEADTKWPPFCRQHFISMKISKFRLKF